MGLWQSPDWIACCGLYQLEQKYTTLSSLIHWSTAFDTVWRSVYSPFSGHPHRDWQICRFWLRQAYEQFCSVVGKWHLHPRWSSLEALAHAPTSPIRHESRYKFWFDKEVSRDQSWQQSIQAITSLMIDLIGVCLFLWLNWLIDEYFLWLIEDWRSLPILASLLHKGARAG